MNQYLEDFLIEFPLQAGSIQAPKSRLEQYSNRIPKALIDFWGEIGWSGFAEGLLWSTDPEEIQPAVELWLKNTNSLESTSYTAIARSAFGKIYLWGKKPA